MYLSMYLSKYTLNNCIVGLQYLTRWYESIYNIYRRNIALQQFAIIVIWAVDGHQQLM